MRWMLSEKSWLQSEYSAHAIKAFLKKRAAHTKCDLWVWEVFPTGWWQKPVDMFLTNRKTVDMFLNAFLRTGSSQWT